MIGSSFNATAPGRRIWDFGLSLFRSALLVACAGVMLAGAFPSRVSAQNALGDALIAGSKEQDTDRRRSSSDTNVQDKNQDPRDRFDPVTITVGGDRQTARDARDTDASSSRRGDLLTPPPEPGEFEKFVTAKIGRSLLRFGASLIADARGFAPATQATVPADYRMSPGDTISVGLTGTVEGQLNLTIDNNGRVFIPRVGSATLSGVRYGDLQEVLRSVIGRQFKEFQVSVSPRALTGIRVYVTGYVASPGAYTVSSLSTLANAVLAAGGPTAAGSFRVISLQRNGVTVTTLDLYDLLIKGDKSRDVALQNEDVVFIGPVGAQIAVIGSVNYAAIFEVGPTETLGDVLRYAGGVNSVADVSRLLLARVANQKGSGWESLTFDQARTTRVEAGSILRILPATGLTQPVGRQAVLVTIDGEVERPGNYYLAPGSTVADLMAQAGPFTHQAYLYGARFLRESIRVQQEASFEQAIAEVELSLAAQPIVDRQARSASGELQLRAARVLSGQLRTQHPDGRIMLDTPIDAAHLPTGLALENNDRIMVPSRPITIGVFGAVYQAGSFAEVPDGTIGAYLAMAGGPRPIANRSDLFVVRANGSILAAKLRGLKRVLEAPAYPGDVVFVPVKAAGDRLMDTITQVATTIYQVTLGAVALKVLAQ